MQQMISLRIRLNNSSHSNRIRSVRERLAPSLQIIECMLLIVTGLGLPSVCRGQRPDFETARQDLVARFIEANGVSDPRVLDVMRSTKRHEFIPLAQRRNAYYDMALPIGAHQTISSPFIVAYMTESLQPQPTDRVLEIGTGSGYQAAVLSPLVESVYTIEIVESLGQKAKRLLKRLDYDNVHVKIGDGYLGWPEYAPFDKIIVTCSPERVPRPLVEQLREGGRMVIPVGERYQQTLYLFTKKDGKLERQELRPTLFVPMTGQAEERRETQPNARLPSIANGSFEETGDGDLDFSSWYYQRQVQQVSDAQAPVGQHVARFENDTRGRASSLLQGFAIDGRYVRDLDVSAWVRLQQVERGATPDLMPAIIVSFYDENRVPLGERWLGPWTGTADWHEESEQFRVPIRTREGILRIGLFGATGRMDVDNVRLRIPQKGAVK
jgi:protein-L-isoaspartate(D-aspartate) O-methyltransferase